MRVYDVIIVGAGPAGSALAAYLAREGYRVLLLEKQRFPRDKVCGDFVSPRGLAFLRDLGCMSEIERTGYVRIRKSSIFLNGRKISEGYLPRLPGYPPYGCAIPRSRLDEIIFRQAQNVGAETVEDCRVDDFYTAGDAVIVRAGVQTSPRRFAGRLIVGADGAQSTVARKVGLDMQDHRYVLASIRAYSHGLPLRETILAFDEEFFPGFGWIFPVKDDTCNVGVGMVSEPLTKEGIHLKAFFARFREFLETLAEHHGHRVEIGRPVGWPIKTYGGARRNYFDRGLLIGEAACLVDPISGEGIPLALESAAIAADTIRDVFRSGDFSERGLAGYESRWRARFDPDLKISDLIVSMIRNRHLVKLWMTSFEVMSRTALDDEQYALKTGGILAGLVPNREGLSPDVVLKSIFHGPEFWLRLFEISPQRLLPDLVNRLLDAASWQSTALQHVLNDVEWSANWWREIDQKQRQVFRTTWGGLGPVKRYASTRESDDIALRIYPS